MKWTEKEILYLKENYGNIEVKEIMIILNKSRQCIYNKAISLGLKPKISRNRQTIKEKLLNSTVKIIGSYNLLRDKCNFICPYCNNSFITTPDKVAHGHTKSCGCVKIGKRTGGKYISGEYFSRIKSRVKKRDLEFNLTIEFIESLLIKQNFKCALSNLPINIGYSRNENYTASLDRIDSSKGYTEDNVQWIHKDVNWMKQEFNQEYYIDICKKVADNARN